MRMIWLIRHGESSIDTAFAFSTFAGAPLTQRGHQQAHQVAALFTESPSVVVTSSFLRAQQTAQPTLQRFPQLRAEEWPIQEFTYLAFPTDRAVTKAELQPQTEAYWQRGDPDYCDGSQAESFTLFMQRVQNTLATLRQRPEHFLVLFTHELFISALIWVLLTRPTEITAVHMRHFYEFAKGVWWPHASVLKLAQDQEQEFWIGGVMTTHLSCP